MTTKTDLRITGDHQHLGYVEEIVHGHPLADGRGRIMQHRRIMYALLGPGSQHCFYCSKTLEWRTGRKRKGDNAIEIDHIDGDRTNNVVSNWVVTCTGCNTRPAQRGDHSHRVREAAA